eukprot:UN09986
MSIYITICTKMLTKQHPFFQEVNVAKSKERIKIHHLILNLHKQYKIMAIVHYNVVIHLYQISYLNLFHQFNNNLMFQLIQVNNNNNKVFHQHHHHYLCYHQIY